MLFYGQVGNFTEFQQGAFVTLQSYHQDRSSIGICLRNSRRVTVARQVALGTGYFVAYVIGCCFQIDGQLELYRDTALSLLADAGQRTDTRNTIDVLFQGFGNLILDYIGISTRIGAGY